MPRNNSTSISARLANIVPRGRQLIENIPGSHEWCVKQAMEHPKPEYGESNRAEFFERMTTEKAATYSKYLPLSGPILQRKRNEMMIDNIHNWITANQWQYIEGDDCNGYWVNSKYPNQIFHGASYSYTISRGEKDTIEFPVSSSENDPLGIACHYITDIDNLKTTICPNKWTKIDLTRKGRRQAVRNKIRAKKRAYWEKYQTIALIRNDEERRLALILLKNKSQLNNLKYVN